MWEIFKTFCNQKIGIDLSAEHLKKFQQYFSLLCDTNEKMNLVSFKTPLELIYRHFCDCMFVVKAIKERCGATDARLKIIDLGSGAGFPAIIVSIIFDQSECVLIESITKKCIFLNDVKKALNLNCQIINERAEVVEQAKKYRQQFDFALSRAVCKFSQNLEIAIAPLRVGGHFLVCKTKRSIDEKEGGLQSVGQALKTLGAKLDKISSYNLPTSDLEYCILDFCKIFPTPNVYPRNASLMQKKPL